MNYEEFKRGWSGGLPETKCGAGSRFANTLVQRGWIPEKVIKYGITSIADLGAGDLNWANRTEFGCKYSAYDLVPRAPGVDKLDILTDELPEADCLMVLWVINHMTEEQAQQATVKIMNSKARYLLATWREDYFNFPDAKVLDSVQIFGDAEIRLYEL